MYIFNQHFNKYLVSPKYFHQQVLELYCMSLKNLENIIYTFLNPKTWMPDNGILIMARLQI